MVESPTHWEWCIDHDPVNEVCRSHTINAGPGVEVSLTYSPADGTWIWIRGAISDEMPVEHAPELAYALLMAHAMHHAGGAR